MEDRFAWLRDVKHRKTVPFLKQHNERDAAFQSRLGLAKKLAKEMRRRIGEEEEELPWVGRDGLEYQYRFEKGNELETLFRKGKASLDLNHLGIENPGSIEPFMNSCVVGSSDGEPFL